MARCRGESKKSRRSGAKKDAKRKSTGAIVERNLNTRKRQELARENPGTMKLFPRCVLHKL